MIGVGEGVAVGAFVISTIGFMWKMSSDVGQIKDKFSQDIQHLDEKYVDKDVCKVIHNQTASDIQEIKQDVKSLLKK